MPADWSLENGAILFWHEIGNSSAAVCVSRIGFRSKEGQQEQFCPILYKYSFVILIYNSIRHLSWKTLGVAIVFVLL